MKHIVLSLAALLALAGCAQQPLPPTALQARSVGVAAALGDHLNYQTVGFMVFGNETTSGDIHDWALDRLVTDQIKQRLQPRRDVTVVDATHDVLDPPSTTNTGIRLIDSLAASSQPTVGERLKQMLGPNGPTADLWVVVLSGMQQDTIGRTNQPLSGIGSYHHDGLFTKAHETPYVAADVMVIDGHSFKLVASQPLSTEDALVPFTFLADQAAHDRWADLTVSEREALHQAIATLLRTAIDHTLTSLGLTGR